MEMSIPSPGSIKDPVWVFESSNLGLFIKVSFIFLYSHIYTLFLAFKLQTYLITAGIT